MAGVGWHEEAYTERYRPACAQVGAEQQLGSIIGTGLATAGSGGTYDGVARAHTPLHQAARNLHMGRSEVKSNA